MQPAASPLHAFEQQVQATAASQQALARATEELQQREHHLTLHALSALPETHTSLPAQTSWL